MSHLKYGLGIDTGGTFTDAVIYDFDGNQIIESAKSPTTRHDLQVGIENVLDKLSAKRLTQVCMVSLSTTLATNAAVEGKMGRGTLVLIGCDPETVREKGDRYGLPPCQDIIFVEGGHNQRGEVLSPPDWDELRDKVLAQRASTDGFAVTQLWGMRNPEFEQKAKQLIAKWAGVPVVCAHEILGDLNFLKRAATVLLNVRLIPIMDRFLQAIEQSLQAKGIRAPMTIVRGDGGLMTRRFAKERPLETLLSGPAASVTGGLTLTGRDNCVIVDMGGTTTDLALVNRGKVKLANGGIQVGQWVTGTKSIYLQTIGLGGDSAVVPDSDGTIIVGPQRVTPLSLLACQWPELKARLRSFGEKYPPRFVYLLQDGVSEHGYTTQEREVIRILRAGPLTMRSLARALHTSIFDLRLDNLRFQDVIMESSLTPTDLMHIRGDYLAGDREAAQLGAEVLADQLEVSLSELIERVNETIRQRLYLTILTMLLEDRDATLIGHGVNERTRRLMMLGYRSPDAESEEETISCRFQTGFDLIGIGAPIHIYLPDVARSFDAKSVVPPQAAVANALGAITGKVWVREEVKIEPVIDGLVISGYVCYSSRQRTEFSDYPVALAWATNEARQLAQQRAHKEEACDIQVFVDVDKRSNRGVLLDASVTANAVGTFQWL